MESHHLNIVQKKHGKEGNIGSSVELWLFVVVVIDEVVFLNNVFKVFFIPLLVV